MAFAASALPPRLICRADKASERVSYRRRACWMTQTHSPLNHWSVLSQPPHSNSCRRLPPTKIRYVCINTLSFNYSWEFSNHAVRWSLCTDLGDGGVSEKCGTVRRKGRRTYGVEAIQVPSIRASGSRNFINRRCRHFWIRCRTFWNVWSTLIAISPWSLNMLQFYWMDLFALASDGLRNSFSLSGKVKRVWTNIYF